MKLKSVKLDGAYRVICYDPSFAFYNEKGNVIYYEDRDGYWFKSEYDKKGKEIYFKDSNGFWVKRKYNKKGNEIYFESSRGEIIDKRVKELTIEEIEKILGYKIKIKGEQ